MRIHVLSIILVQIHFFTANAIEVKDLCERKLEGIYLGQIDELKISFNIFCIDKERMMASLSPTFGVGEIRAVDLATAETEKDDEHGSTGG